MWFGLIIIVFASFKDTNIVTCNQVNVRIIELFSQITTNQSSRIHLNHLPTSNPCLSSLVFSELIFIGIRYDFC